MENKVAQRKVSLPCPPLKLPPHTHNVRVWGAALAEQARGGDIRGVRRSIAPPALP